MTAQPEAVQAKPTPQAAPTHGTPPPQELAVGLGTVAASTPVPKRKPRRSAVEPRGQAPNDVVESINEAAIPTAQMMGGDAAQMPAAQAPAPKQRFRLRWPVNPTQDWLESIRDVPIKIIGPEIVEVARGEVEECNANHRLHVLVGSDQAVLYAGIYRMLFFARIDELTSICGATLHPDAQQAIEAAKRIRAASWWVRYGPGTPLEILEAANLWAAGRKAAKIDGGN